MAKVLGIGGVFFKCRDRDRLTAWYAEHLGLPVNDYCGAEFLPDGMPPGSYTVWGPFKEDTEYFQPSDKPYMINLVVDDVAAVLKRAVAGGAEAVGEIESHDYGRFGWFLDPEGNKIELWQPSPAD